MATKPVNGVIYVDIRKSTPNWEPYEPSEAPFGAHNVKGVVYLSCLT
jgi:hypothetical protein